jgi:hypothetical protein
MPEPELEYLIVQTSDASLTWIGRSEADGIYIWLCSPGGVRLAKVLACYVTKSTRKETAHRILEEAKHHESAFNPS